MAKFRGNSRITICEAEDKTWGIHLVAGEGSPFAEKQVLPLSTFPLSRLTSTRCRGKLPL
jgi:hypothetical protein